MIKFKYLGQEYELGKYPMPEGIKRMGRYDRMVMADERTSPWLQQRILDRYLPGAILQKEMAVKTLN